MAKQILAGGYRRFTSGGHWDWRVRALLLGACGAVLVGGGSGAGAAILTWDVGNSPAVPVDGSGFWDVSNSLSNPDSNWSNGTGDSTWVNGDTASIGSGGTAGTITIDDGSGAVTAAGINFNAVGSGSYVVAATSGDSLALTGLATVPATITMAAGTSATISAPISGANGLTLAGTGTLNLSGLNAYGGNTVLNSGTLNLNAGGTLGSGAGVVMGIIGATPGGQPTPLTTVSTLNVNTNATVSSFTANTNSTSNNTLTIGSGSTLTVSGAFSVTLNPKAGSGTSHTNLVVSGAGTLNATNSSNASFQAGTGELDSANAAGQESATLNMSGLSNFVFSTGTGEFDVGNGSHGQGIVDLANTSNSITAATVRVADSTDGTISGNAGGASLLSLGAGTNVIDANTIDIGDIKDTGTLGFQGASGSLTINNEAGTGAAVMNVGLGSSGTSSANGTVNLLGHQVSLTLSTLNIGNRSNSASSNVGGIGVFLFDDGTVTTTSLVLGHCQGSSSTTGFSDGTMQVGSVGDTNTATLVLSGGANLGQVSSAGTNSTSTTLLLIDPGGTVNSSNSFGISVNGTGDVVNATVELSGGTLNMNGHNITNATNATTSAVNNVTFITTGGLLQSMGTINGTGGVTMNTAGNTLTIAGTNAWTGATNVSAGTVVLATLPVIGGLGDTPITIASGATFVAQSGTSAGNTTTAAAGATLNASAGATISLVDGTVGTFDLVQGASFSGTALTLAGDTLDFDLGVAGADELVVNGPGTASVSGNNTVNVDVIAGSASLPLGTFPLISDTSGGMTGNFDFSNNTDTETVMDASGNTYTLTLSNTSTGEFLNIGPEPTTLGVVMVGMGLLGGRRRRRG